MIASLARLHRSRKWNIAFDTIVLHSPIHVSEFSLNLASREHVGEIFAKAIN